jgi:hypothetical protein
MPPEYAARAVKLASLKILEVDYLPGQEDWICELAARHPWSYLIGLGAFCPRLLSNQ